MEVVRLSAWSEFVALTESQPGWAFRGELSAQWPLVSSLTRRLETYCEDRSLWPLREERALRIFRRKAHIYLEDRSALADDLRSLALMQHHGAPTRLLDFTKSPYVAAFFALQNLVGTDPAVCAAGYEELHRKVMARLHPELTLTEGEIMLPGPERRLKAG